MTGTLINLQLTILTYIAVGFILYRTKIINSSGQDFLSAFSLSVLLPISVYVSFMNNMSIELLSGLVSVLVVATGIEIILYLFTKIPTHKIFNPRENCVYHYSVLVSNGGLIGTPIIEGLFGGVGVMFCNVFLIPTRIMAYTAGESVFNPSLHRTLKEIIITTLKNKIIIAMFLALICITLNISLPEPCFNALSKIGQCLSPMCMILVGTMLAEKMDFNLKSLSKIMLITLIRLIAIPLCTLFVCVLLKMDFMNTAIVTLIMGMPAGSTCAAFAKKYKGDSGFASLTVFATTLLSSITLVCLMKIIEMVFA